VGHGGALTAFDRGSEAAWAADNGGQGCGGGPARGYAREGKMLWTKGARLSKEDRRATAEHVLRPREALRAGAGAGDAGGMRGGSGGGGATWRGGNKPA
jgi:hypothetical protein